MMLAFRGYPLGPEHIAMPGKNADLPGICRAPFHRAQTQSNLRPTGLESASLRREKVAFDILPNSLVPNRPAKFP